MAETFEIKSFKWSRNYGDTFFKKKISLLKDVYSTITATVGDVQHNVAQNSLGNWKESPAVVLQSVTRHLLILEL